MSETMKGQILVVDDERSIRESMALLLNAAGYTVTTAKDGFDALLQLRRETPDVIVSDHNIRSRTARRVTNNEEFEPCAIRITNVIKKTRHYGVPRLRPGWE